MNTISASAVSNAPELDNAKNAAPEKPEKSFSDVMKSQSADPTESLTKSVGRFVDRVADDERRVEGAMHRMMSGRELDSVELLRTQALIYGHAQRVELASKCVEKATSGLKQMMNTQV
jgi:hypothetical protein